MPDSHLNEKTTDALVNDLRAIRSQLEQNKVDRHRSNNEIMKTIGQFSDSHALQKEEIAGIKGDVGEIKDDIRLIKTRLVGDEDMRSPGLVDDVKNLASRMSAVESETHSLRQDAVFIRRFVAVVSTLLGVVATAAGIYITLIKP